MGLFGRNHDQCAKVGQAFRHKSTHLSAYLGLLTIAMISSGQLLQRSEQGTSTIAAYGSIENAASEECPNAQKDVLTEVPIGRIDLAPNPVDIPQPLAPAGSNEQDDPGALNRRAPAVPKPSTQQKEGQSR